MVTLCSGSQVNCNDNSVDGDKLKNSPPRFQVIHHPQVSDSSCHSPAGNPLDSINQPVKLSSVWTELGPTENSNCSEIMNEAFQRKTQLPQIHESMKKVQCFVFILLFQWLYLNTVGHAFIFSLTITNYPNLFFFALKKAKIL